MPKASDYRDAAVAASERLLAEHPGVDPLQTEFSYCIEIDPQGRQFQRRGTIGLIITATIGIAGMAMGAVFALIARGSQTTGEENRYLTVAVICFVAGLFLLSAFVILHRRRMLSRIRARIGEFPAGARTVNVRNAAHQGAISRGDESAVLILYPEQRCVQLEGVTHRHLIRGQDVQAVRLIGGGEYSITAVTLTYRVGDVPLVLGLTSDRIARVMLSGTFGSWLFDELKHCLRV
jgi:hypothetical protein